MLVVDRIPRKKMFVFVTLLVFKIIYLKNKQ